MSNLICIVNNVCINTLLTIIMNTIGSISPNNNFTDSEKMMLDIIIKLLTMENNTLSQERQRFVGQVLFTISICKGDVNLVRWCLDNHYGSASTLITNSHIEFANQFGFNMEPISSMGRKSPDNIQQVGQNGGLDAG